ncbi:MAG: deoxyuridine 5'-triphosphate nucleotidohydrolase [Candidatus Hodarchaeota archaeon]
MTVLDRQTILDLITHQKLITSLKDPRVQVSPNGVELTLHKIYTFKEAGMVDFSNAERYIPKLEEHPIKNGCYKLKPGTYLITYNEVVQLPTNLIAIGRPRSSLLRSGVTVESAVWDAGYKGRARGLLTVFNSHGFQVKPDARLLHLVFYELVQETQPYAGVYQGET